MSNRTILAAAIALAACWCLVPEIRAQQDDSPSAFDKCRIVTTKDLADTRLPAFAAYPVSSPETVETPKLDRFLIFFRKLDFFNSHRISRHLSEP